MRSLRTPTRVVVGLFSVAALLRPAALTAEDEPSSPYFAARFSDSWALIERIAAGADGTVLVCGRSDNLELPGALEPPAEDTEFWGGHAFAALIERDGRVRWTRYLDPGRFYGICVAPDGAVWTVSTRDDRSASSTGVRVTKLGADGAVLANVDLVGARAEQATGLALTPDGDAIVVGTTDSPDFPSVNAFQPTLEGDLDGFVARIAGDGSGIVWSTFVGGPGWDDATAVAVDAAGDVLVATRRRADQWSGQVFEVEYSWGLTSVALVRLSGDGVPKSTLELPAGDYGGAFAVAVAPDGRILVGGSIGFTDRGPSEGYVLPVDPVTSAIGVPWHEPGLEVRRIALGPDGSVLVATDRNWTDYTRSNRWVGGGFVHLAADLGSVLRRVDREEYWGVLDAVLASDGAICLVGRGSGVIPLFHEAGTLDSSREWNFDTAFVARLPASGPAPPRNVRVVRTTQTEAVISWKDGADAPVAVRVEAEQTGYLSNRLYRPIRRARDGAHAIRVRGLKPGASHELRLVAEFASGERVAVRLPTVKTLPAPVRSVQVRLDEVRGFHVHWDCGDPGDRTGFELERSVNREPFEPVEGYSGGNQGYAPSCPYDSRFHDKQISSGDGVVVYRVRAVTKSPRVVTRWRYTFPMFVK